jgi:amino acid transporter
MTIDYLSASNGYAEVAKELANGKLLSDFSFNAQEAYLAWTSAPTMFGFHLIADLPALLIIFLITWLVYRGIKESKNASNAMVIIKLAVVLLVIAVGAFYVDTANWHPFAPNGVGGILKGVSAVFFAYIGFDAISTTAEECKNPQKDLPKGMMWAIIICTILYVVIALVLTGMVHYTDLAVNDPLAFVFEKLNLKWLSGIIAVSAVVAMASVLLVFQLGQPRIWMSMSRDGLLPKRFSKIHPKFNTPSFATIVTGFIVGGGALFMNMSTVTDLCSIGTLFAFVLVCAGVLKLDTMPNKPERKFKTPYMNAQYIAPIIFIGTVVSIYVFNKENMLSFLCSTDASSHRFDFFVFMYNIPMWIFSLISVYMTIQCYKKKHSLIPVLGLISCLYMMAQIDLKNWIGFVIWLIIGLIIYFTYSYKKSKLNLETQLVKD